jgi:hypothetical protein
VSFTYLHKNCNRFKLVGAQDLKMADVIACFVFLHAGCFVFLHADAIALCFCTQMSLHALCFCTQIASLEAVIGDEERRQAEATQKEQDMQAKLDELQQVCHVYTLA